jgi:hypothetical protein
LGYWIHGVLIRRYFPLIEPLVAVQLANGAGMLVDVVNSQ